MSIDKNHSEQFEKYLKGQMSHEEAHAFEREVLDDPFAMEALEGYESQEKVFIKDLDKLKRKVLSKENRQKPFMRIAAVVALLIVGSFTIYTFTNQLEEESLAMDKEPIEEMFQYTPAPDTSSIPKLKTTKIEKAIAEEIKTEPSIKDGLKVALKDDEIVQLAISNEEVPKKELTNSQSENDTEFQAINEPLLIVAELENAEEIQQQEDGGNIEVLQSRIAGVQVESPQMANTQLPVNDQASDIGISNEVKAKKIARSNFNSASNRSVSEISSISGIITDESGESLPGVNVVIKGTTMGVTSDLNGKYELPKVNDMTLIYSFIGFESQEIAVESRNTIDVTMGGTMELQEVVVTATERTNEDVAFSPSQPHGGKKSYRYYLEKNLEYPESAIENDIEGTVILEITISASGVIDSISIKKSIGYGCDEEAIRLVKEGPKWNAAKKGNYPVEDKVKVKVKFKMD